jgi:hypothetical protein
VREVGRKKIGDRMKEMEEKKIRSMSFSTAM